MTAEVFLRRGRGKKRFSPSSPRPLSLINREEEKIDISRPWMRFFLLLTFFTGNTCVFLFCVFLKKNITWFPFSSSSHFVMQFCLVTFLALWHHLGVLNGVHALGALLPKVILADLKFKSQRSDLFHFPEKNRGINKNSNSNTTYCQTHVGGEAGEGGNQGANQVWFQKKRIFVLHPSFISWHKRFP